MRAAVLFFFVVSSANAFATPPTRSVDVAERCKAQNGCFVVLFETLEKPPAVPGAKENLGASVKGAPRRPTPVALPPDPGGEYEFVQGCSSAVGYYVVAQRRSSEFTRVKILRAFNDPALKPFSTELGRGFGPRPSCAFCPMGAGSCTEPFTCPSEVHCVSGLPQFGTKYVAVIKRRDAGWGVEAPLVGKEVWVAGGVDLGWGAPMLADDDMVKALDAAFKATIAPKK